MSEPSYSRAMEMRDPVGGEGGHSYEPKQVAFSKVPSPIGFNATTPLAVKILLWILLALAIAGIVFGFVVAVITFSKGYITNIQTHKRGHELFLNVGSGFKNINWQTETFFDEIVYIYRMVTGSIAIDQMMAIKLWVANTTESASGTLYYSVNSVMDSLLTDVLAAVQVVNPAELQTFLDSMFRKRSVVYTSEFVEYLALVEADIVGLQNTTNAVLTSTFCRGKPLDAISVALVGDQVLAPSSNTTLLWGAPYQQPTGLHPEIFVSNGTALMSEINGIFGVSLAVNLLVSANTMGTTTFSIFLDNASWTQMWCQQEQVNTVAQSFIQCQAAGVLSIPQGSSISVVATTTDGVTVVGWNTRLLLARVC